MNQRSRARAYVFGDTAAEITRLQELGELLRPSTLLMLQEAGITEGMRVLDVGCGPGSVSFLAAGLVGAAGSVVGVDRNPAVLAAARAQGQSTGRSNVSFVRADLAELGAESWLHPAFDAIVGRLVLLHVPDPAALVRALARHLRPGGVVMFQEPDLTCMGASFPPIPALELLCERARQAHRALGIDCQFGLRLPQIFRDAGLPVPSLRCDALISYGPAWGWYRQMLHAARNTIPSVLSPEIAGAEQARVSALAEQAREAIATTPAATRAIDLISAWARQRHEPRRRTAS